MNPNDHPARCGHDGMIAPILAYKNCGAQPDGRRGISMTGGYVYRGSAAGRDGADIFGDWSRNFGVMDGALPRRDRLAGVAEAIRVALIRDAMFFGWLEANADRPATFAPEVGEHMIRRSAELHMRQIAHGGDPFEPGSARPLDFGHWSAHKLEALTHNHLSHGEAVAIGIALDARYSVPAGLLAEGEEGRVDAAARAALAEFDEPTCLHQVAARRDGAVTLVSGLPEALARGTAADGEEWRIHFHVPIFCRDPASVRLDPALPL